MKPEFILMLTYNDTLAVCDWLEKTDVSELNKYLDYQEHIK